MESCNHHKKPPVPIYLYDIKIEVILNFLGSQRGIRWDNTSPSLYIMANVNINIGQSTNLCESNRGGKGAAAKPYKSFIPGPQMKGQGNGDSFPIVKYNPNKIHRFRLPVFITWCGIFEQLYNFLRPFPSRHGIHHSLWLCKSAWCVDDWMSWCGV